MPKADQVGKAQAHAALNGSLTLHAHHQAVEDGPKADPSDGRHPTQQELQALLQQIAPGVGRLPGEIQVYLGIVFIVRAVYVRLTCRKSYL
jgi:hypothetical protein